MCENKHEVQIYDYVDIHVRMLETMYHKRLNGYAAIGYKVRGENVPAESVDIIFDKHNFLPVYCNDIVNALREIVIVSPFVTKRRVLQMSQSLHAAVCRQIKVIAITRPVEDYKAKDEPALALALDMLRKAGVQVVFQPNIHQKFAVIDQRLVWYGSINLLSFGSAKESMMRLESSNIANELLNTVLK